MVGSAAAANTHSQFRNAGDRHFPQISLPTPTQDRSSR